MYNAMAGVGVIFGAYTKTKYSIQVSEINCYVCSRSQTQNISPQQHECFKNWDSSAQSIKADIILEGFLDCEDTWCQIHEDGF